MARITDDQEYLRPPEEFPLPAAQMAPPPPEFGEGGESAASSTQKKKYHWLAAALVAGLLSTVALFSGSEKAILEPFVSPTPQAAVAEATPRPALDHTPSPSPVPRTPSPVPTLTPTPSPEPIVTPAARLTFYRTSQVYHFDIRLAAQEKMSAVTARLADPTLQETIWEHVYTEEEIAFGWYALSNYDLYSREYVDSHLALLQQGYEPDPVLEVTYTVRNDDGTEETFTERAQAAEELWVSFRYDLKNQEEDFNYYFLEETTYPDSFVVRIDPTMVKNIHILYGDDIAALGPGDVAVTVTANGQQIDPAACHLEVEPVIYDGQIFFRYAFVMPRPETFPEHGTVEYTVTRRFINYPANTWKDQRTYEY